MTNSKAKHYGTIVRSSRTAGDYAKDHSVSKDAARNIGKAFSNVLSKNGIFNNPELITSCLKEISVETTYPLLLQGFVLGREISEAQREVFLDPDFRKLVDASVLSEGSGSQIPPDVQVSLGMMDPVDYPALAAKVKNLFTLVTVKLSDLSISTAATAFGGMSTDTLVTPRVDHPVDFGKDSTVSTVDLLDVTRKDVEGSPVERHVAIMGSLQASYTEEEATKQAESMDPSTFSGELSQKFPNNVFLYSVRLPDGAQTLTPGAAASIMADAVYAITVSTYLLRMVSGLSYLIQWKGLEQTALDVPLNNAIAYDRCMAAYDTYNKHLYQAVLNITQIVNLSLVTSLDEPNLELTKKHYQTLLLSKLFNDNVPPKAKAEILEAIDKIGERAKLFKHNPRVAESMKRASMPASPKKDNVIPLAPRRLQ